MSLAISESSGPEACATVESLKPGMKFFGDGRAADHVAAFEHERLVTLFREVERGDERVVPRRRELRFRVARPRLAFPRVFQNFERGKTAGRAHDAAAGMRRRAAHIEFLHRSAVARPAGRRAQEEKLLERKFALENIAFGEPGGAARYPAA